MNELLILQDIFREVLDDPSLVIDEAMTSHDDWDSVATVQIVLAAEERFGVRLKSDDVGKIKSVGDLLNLLKKG